MVPELTGQHNAPIRKLVKGAVFIRKARNEATAKSGICLAHRYSDANVYEPSKGSQTFRVKCNGNEEAGLRIEG